jgi:hypothetical protein
MNSRLNDSSNEEILIKEDNIDVKNSNIEQNITINEVRYNL